MALYTVTREKKLNIILVTPRYNKVFESPIGEKELNRKIAAFRGVLTPDGTGRLRDPLPLAQELCKIIVGPLREELDGLKAETLMWSLDGALRYLPMGALHDGKRYLVETYRMVMYTPASQVAQASLKDTPSAAWRGLGLGVTTEHPGFSALPAVKQELTGVIRSKDTPGIIPGALYLDKGFTWKTMEEELQQEEHYSLVHIARHFQFTPGDDTRSFLLLGDGKHLTLSALKEQDNLFGGVELLTLSACNTAVGDGGKEETGKEVEGFGVLAQRQGAKAVIATLWPVADESTSLIMREMYRVREGSGGVLKSEALRQAQLALLKGDLKPTGEVKEKRGKVVDVGGSTKETAKAGEVQGRMFTPDPNAPYGHPYYWAPFILIGNWK